jgi:anaerobic sulfite reductase subunit B
MHVRGPYGNGWPVAEFEGRHLIIAAGGTGLAPVRSFLRHFAAHPAKLRRLDLLAGFKSPADVLFRDELAAWAKSAGVTLTVDKGGDGWTGNVGLITKFVPALEIPDLEAAAVVVVGPPVMMKFTAMEFLRRGIPEERLWLSFERKMQCGIGKCGHCKIDETYVCLEGPVFPYAKAKRLLD